MRYTFRYVSTDTATKSLLPILRQNAVLWQALERISRLELPDWYLGAGCVAQTVWNHACGNDLNAGIMDYDLVYFGEDLSATAETSLSARVCLELADLNITMDVKNQARVHTWYARRFGHDILPYTSTADAISTWPTTATAVGVRIGTTGVSVCAPYGVADLMSCVVRPNRVQITPEIYSAKVERWSRQWPFLTVLSWEDGVGQIASRLARSV
jgi:hypothetical protein